MTNIATQLIKKSALGLNGEDRATLSTIFSNMEAELNTDPVTGGYNRRYVMKKMREALEQGQDYTLVFIDLDGFKGVNDACGHEEGDRVLWEADLRLEDLIEKKYRSHDVVARIGGDEMVMLLKHEKGRNLSLEKIRAGIRHQFTGFMCWQDETAYPIGASIGTAILSKSEMGTMDVNEYIAHALKVADTSMYEDKDGKIERLKNYERNAMQALSDMLNFERNANQDLSDILMRLAA